MFEEVRQRFTRGDVEDVDDERFCCRFISFHSLCVIIPGYVIGELT